VLIQVNRMQLLLSCYLRVCLNEKIRLSESRSAGQSTV
jgi:hypothetical protein